MDKREFLALAIIHAPEPSKEIIGMYIRMDQQKNPHNDSYKPRRRTENEIISELKSDYAQALYTSYIKLI